ncbi:hypothetical protein LSAT2_013266 [Lamellibrachia satsuma]|nr:hypothetical protein LSAT2_013266 [Lamellibrachia satsuma]
MRPPQLESLGRSRLKKESPVFSFHSDSSRIVCRSRATTLKAVSYLLKGSSYFSPTYALSLLSVQCRHFNRR